MKKRRSATFLLYFFREKVDFPRIFVDYLLNGGVAKISKLARTRIGAHGHVGNELQ